MAIRRTALAALIAIICLIAACGAGPGITDTAVPDTASPIPLSPIPVGTTFVGDNGYTEPLVFRDAAGHELVVPACSRRTSTDFDGTSLVVMFESDRVPISQYEPTSAGPYRWIFENAAGGNVSQDLPFAAPSFPPCTGRGG